VTKFSELTPLPQFERIYKQIILRGFIKSLGHTLTTKDIVQTLQITN